MAYVSGWCLKHMTARLLMGTGQLEHTTQNNFTGELSFFCAEFKVLTLTSTENR